MQKLFLYSLLVSLLLASALAAPSNYRFKRFVQEITNPEQPIVISPAPESNDNSTLPTAPVNTTIIVDNTTLPVDNTTIPVDNTTIPVDNTTIPVDNTTIPVDNSTQPIDNSTVPIPSDNSTQSEQNITTFQDTNATQFIKVIGRSSGKVKFGQVMIGFTVETLDSQAGNALQNNTQIVNTTMEQLKSLGLNETDISVSGIQVLPIYSASELISAVNETSSEQSGELQVEQGQSEQNLQFRVRNSFIVSTNQTDLVGQILDSAMQNGVNYIDYVNYTSSEDDLVTLREQLLEDALDHAERLAKKIIEKLGYEMGPVMNVNIIDDKSETVLLGDESSQLFNNSQNIQQQLVEVQYAMRIPQQSSSQ